MLCVAQRVMDIYENNIYDKGFLKCSINKVGRISDFCLDWKHGKTRACHLKENSVAGSGMLCLCSMHHNTPDTVVRAVSQSLSSGLLRKKQAMK